MKKTNEKNTNNDDFTMEDILLQKPAIGKTVVFDAAILMLVLLFGAISFWAGTTMVKEVAIAPVKNEVVVDLSEIQILLEQLDDKVLVLEEVGRKSIIMSTLIDERLKSRGMLLNDNLYNDIVNGEI